MILVGDCFLMDGGTFRLTSQPDLSCWQVTVTLPAVVFAGLNKALCLDNDILSS